ncbi:MAG: hypothetical protein WA188_11405 [Terriglobales bacterium]
MNRIRQTPVTWVLLLGVLACGTVWAQNQPPVSPTVTEFRDATGAISTGHVIETRRQGDGRTVEARVVEAPSINGGYQPVSDTERETIRVDANTVRVVQRWFSSWAGERQLFKISEEERRTEPGGRESVTRTISTLNAGGYWNVQERVIEESVSTAPDTRVTRKTMLGIVAGDLVPIQQLEETEQRKGNLVEVRRKLLSSNAIGYAPVSEVQETLVMPTRDGEITQEKTYSTYVPEVGSYGELHLAQQREVSTTTAPDRSTRTEEKVQQVNPGNPSDGLRTTSLIIEVSQPLGNLRTETHEETHFLDVNGDLPLVWVTDSLETKEAH